MLATYRTRGLGQSFPFPCVQDGIDWTKKIPTGTDDQGNKVRLPHRLIEHCLDREWADSAKCGLSAPFNVPCLPDWLYSLLNLPLSAKERTAAIHIAFCVIGELPNNFSLFMLSRQPKLVTAIEKARQVAAEVLCCGPPQLPLSLGHHEPELSVTSAINVLATEVDPIVIRHMLAILGDFPSKQTPLELIERAVLAINGTIDRGILDADDKAFAIAQRKKLEVFKPRVTQPVKPPITPDQPKPKPTSTAKPSRVAPILVGVALLAGAGALTFYAVKQHRAGRMPAEPRPRRRLVPA
jgi:hypothetical protein